MLQIAGMLGKFLVAILLFVVASGCVVAPLDPPSDPAPPTGATRTFPWGISDCAFAIVSVPVDEARLAARLPEGFTLSDTRLSTLPAGPRAAIEMDAYACRSGIGLNATITDLDYGSYYAAVQPPQPLREAGYDAYFVKWNPLVPDAARREAFRAGGLAAHSGSASVAVSEGGGSITASLTLEGAGGFRLTGAIEPPRPIEGPLPFMEYTPLETSGALARWHARLHDAMIGQGAGEVELVPGSWVAELVGSDRAAATVIAGAWNLDEADVTFPIPWPTAQSEGRVSPEGTARANG